MDGNRHGKARGDEERAFLESYDPSAFERLSVAVDVVVLTAAEGELRALLVRRREHPDAGRWALPGGFMGPREGLDEAARRVLAGKAGLTGVFLEQLYTFGEPERDPRTRIVSVAYYALVAPERLAGLEEPGEVALARLTVPWPGEGGGPVGAELSPGAPLELAFDHADILGAAVRRVRGKLDYAPIGLELLPERFTLRELRLVHEAVLARPLNKDSFRRRLLASGLLAPTSEREAGTEHRPAELYTFARQAASKENP